MKGVKVADKRKTVTFICLSESVFFLTYSVILYTNREDLSLQKF